MRGLDWVPRARSHASDAGTVNVVHGHSGSIPNLLAESRAVFIAAAATAATGPHGESEREAEGVESDSE
jgi:hypothetical protein